MDEQLLHRDRALRSILKVWPLPLVGETDPYQLLGVTRSTIAESVVAPGRQRPPYVGRDVDGELRAALLSCRLVVVSGPSKAGKSRTAFEALADTFPRRRLIVPIAPATLAGSGAARAPVVALAENAPFGVEAVLWLDDAQRQIGPGQLTQDVLARLSESLPGLVVVATIREQELNALRALEELAPAINGLLLDPRAKLIRLEANLSEGELACAIDRYPAYGRRANLGRIGEFFVAADELIAKYQTSPAVNKFGAAVIRAALDWQRAGMVRPVTWAELRDLTRLYLPGVDVGVDFTDAGFADGLVWARQSVSSSATLLLAVQEGGDAGYRVFDFLLEWAGLPKPSRTPRQLPARLVTNEEPVPDHTWKYVQARAQPGDWLAIALGAHLAGNRPIEVEAWLRAVSVDGPSGWAAAVIHGNVLQAVGEPDAALAEYQRALDGGHAEHVAVAALMSGLLHRRRGEAEAARGMYQRAIEAGGAVEVLAELYLSAVLGEQGDDEGRDAHGARALAIGAWSPLERAIMLSGAAGGEGAGDSDVRARFSEGATLALGFAAGNTSVVGSSGTEVDLLHFSFDDADGVEQVATPVFTRTEFLQDAVYGQPDWQSLGVVLLDGGLLLANLDPEVIAVINPWSPLEFQLPPPHDARRQN